MENIASVRLLDQLPGAAAGAALSRTTMAHGELTPPSLAHPISTGFTRRHEGGHRPICHGKLLWATKHFPGFYVFTGEEKIS